MGERNPSALYCTHKQIIHDEFYRYRQSIEPIHTQTSFPLILTEQHQILSASYQQTKTPYDSSALNTTALKQESTARAPDQSSTPHSQSSSSVSMPYDQHYPHNNFSKPSSWNRNSNAYSLPHPPPPAMNAIE